jgi:hypothetical protein
MFDTGFYKLGEEKWPTPDGRMVRAKDVDVTGSGDAAEILSVVVNGLVDKYKSTKGVVGFQFTSFEDNRTSLYRRIANLFAEELNLEVFQSEPTEAYGTDFFLVDKNLLGETKKLTELDNEPEVKFSLNTQQPLREVLDVVDKKGEKQVANTKFSLAVDKKMNQLIFENFGIEPFKEYSDSRAERLGKQKDGLKVYPASMYDMEAFVRELLGKGAVGEKQMKFFEDNLFKPYNEGVHNLSKARIRINKEFNEIKKKLVESKVIPANLSKSPKDSSVEGYTYEDIVRVYTWNKQGIKIDGLSEKDLKAITAFVSKDAGLQELSNKLIEINRSQGYHYPGKDWIAGNISTDIKNGLNKGWRKKFLKKWKDNVDLIFSDKVLNKLQVAKGNKYRESLEHILKRMYSGTNRNVNAGDIETKLLNLINNSSGTVMFLNTRSMILQLLSLTNFIEPTGDNNLLKAAGAFANQKQYWKDVIEIFNSPYLVDRRDGLKINVSENEIADAVKNSKNPFNAFVSLILTKGYSFTKFGDSAAIALGGATFRRNRIKGLMKRNPNLTLEEAEKRADVELREKAEISQQSADPSKIGKQQASAAGRLILSFGNTPIQYNRIILGAIKDLKNGRGSIKDNVSKILYYGTMQNAIFTALQQALFMVLGDDEEPEEEKERYIKVVDGMLSNILKGFGVGGVGISTMKSFIQDLYSKYSKSQEPDANWYEKNPKYSESAWKLLEFSPPISIKMRKIKSALTNWEINKGMHENNPWAYGDPIYESTALAISGLTDIPLDRLMYKLENIKAAFFDDLQTWQSIARLMGYKEWEVETKDQKEERKEEESKARKVDKGYESKKSKFKSPKFKTPKFKK